jgi:predicted XRE-type DNA-binding protein
VKDLAVGGATKLLEVTQPRISDLKNGKIEKFTIDMLVKMLGKLNRKVDFKIKPSKVREAFPLP